MNDRDPLWPFRDDATFWIGIVAAMWLGGCIVAYLDRFWWRVCP